MVVPISSQSSSESSDFRRIEAQFGPDIFPTISGGDFMTTTSRLMPMVAMLFVALVDGSLSTGPASAEDVCLPAPNAPAPQGSHWHYRTDPVKQSKCWYLQTEGPAFQKQAAQETPEPGVGTKRPAPIPPITDPDQLGPEPLELRPAEAAPAASADKPTKGNIQHSARANRQAGTDKAAWPNPPLPVGSGKVAWPRPPSLVGADKVAWPDPPSPAGADKVAWPDPPSPARGATAEVAAENTPAAPSTPEEKAKQTQGVPPTAANSAEAGDGAGPDRHIAKPTARLVAQDEVPISLLLAFAIGLVIAGLIVRWIVRMAFARRPKIDVERREPSWTTGVASERTTPTFVAQDRDLAPGSLDADHLDDEVKESLRKLLRVLDGQTL